MTPRPVVDAERDLVRHIGRQLRSAREARGLSLKQAAQASEGRFGAPTLGTYERAERQAPSGTLASLAALYGVRVVDLLPAETVDAKPEEDGS